MRKNSFKVNLMFSGESSWCGPHGLGKTKTNCTPIASFRGFVKFSRYLSPQMRLHHPRR
jgi:hypothetical protein